MRLFQRTASFILALTMIFGLALDARAAGVGPRVSVQGVLFDAQGHLLEQQTVVVFRIYASASGGVPLVVNAQSVMAVQGHFAAVLDERVLLDANLNDFDSLYVSSQAGNGPESRTRTHLKHIVPAA